MTGVAFAVWAAVAVWLWLKMFAISLLQARLRVMANSFVLPEDQAAFGRKDKPERAAGKRLQILDACWRNDLENIPVFLILALGAAIATPGSVVLLAVLPLFALARTAHTIAYINRRQPHRNIAYLTGVLCTMVVAGLLLSLAVDTLRKLMA